MDRPFGATGGRGHGGDTNATDDGEIWLIERPPMGTN
jgi:hypothetical protein